MIANPFLGVVFHALGGFAAGSFYAPTKKVRNWAWETYWLTLGVFAWIIAPLVAASIMAPDLWGILRDASARTIFWTYFFGAMWGIGAVTFGLTMRYLGMSLGMSVALGFCAIFGTLIPPLYEGTILELFIKLSGGVTFAGILVCVLGIGICGKAGMMKERQLSPEEKTAAIKEFNLVKGIWVAVFAGVLSACMAFAFRAGIPIGKIAVDHGMRAVNQNVPVLVVVLLGGFTTNLIWCLGLNIRNRTLTNYIDRAGSPLATNYFFCLLAGVTWYLQFFFYGMGTTQMGKYDFSSWTLHMAFIIIFSNMWGLLVHEWRGVSKSTYRTLFVGIALLILSTVVVGSGNYLASRGW